ncbi:cytosine permease [Candidatus Pelagibacter sp.]|uniref:cytosine permease n=1 Tax=Candidatus Pelagibacter sp. TaxID=2024849 RepID=UPI003F858B13
MSQQKTKKTLINWDLVTVNPNNKTWDWKDLFCFWGVNIQSVIGFSLIASLYLIYNLNTGVVFFGTILGTFFVYIFSNLIGKPSQKFGLPFVVLLRSSLGFRGAQFFGLLRSIVGIFMFGIQTYFLSKAIGFLVRVLMYSIDNSILQKEILLVFFIGLNIIDWAAILISIILQTYLFSVGMNYNKKLIKFSALTIYAAMIMFFFIVLLSDVKLTAQSFIDVLDFQNIFNPNNVGPIITVAGTTFTFFSIVILSFGDFSRYVKNEQELRKGNLSLILNLIIFSFFALFIVTGADAFQNLNEQNVEMILTNPTDIIGKLDNILLVSLALIFIIIASASTNLIANFIPSQYTLINFDPSSFSLKSASYVIAIFGFIIGVFWLTFLSQVGVLSYIDTIGAFFGPLFGLMIADFYMVKKGKLENKDIYSLETSGTYYYSGGWHFKGVYSLILGFIFSASTIWNTNFMFLQSYSWIIGAFVTAFVYYLLARE